MSRDKNWHPNTGERPVQKATAIYARIRVVDRETAERQGPKPADFWKRWKIEGDSPGDIIEWRRA